VCCLLHLPYPIMSSCIAFIMHAVCKKVCILVCFVLLPVCCVCRVLSAQPVHSAPDDSWQPLVSLKIWPVRYSAECRVPHHHKQHQQQGPMTHQHLPLLGPLLHPQLMVQTWLLSGTNQLHSSVSVPVNLQLGEV
jgi:hypothetical protein